MATSGDLEGRTNHFFNLLDSKMAKAAALVGGAALGAWAGWNILPGAGYAVKTLAATGAGAAAMAAAYPLYTGAKGLAKTMYNDAVSEQPKFFGGGLVSIGTYGVLASYLAATALAPYSALVTIPAAIAGYFIGRPIGSGIVKGADRVGTMASNISSSVSDLFGRGYNSFRSPIVTLKDAVIERWKKGVEYGSRYSKALFGLKPSPTH